MMTEPMNQEQSQRLTFMINEKFKQIVNENSMEIANYIVERNFPDGIITEKEIIAQVNLKIDPEDIKLMLEKIKRNPASKNHFM